MKKSTMITRIVCLSISLVILIIAMVFSSGSESVIAGAGSGRNEKIASVNEMSDMLDSFSEYFSGFNFSSADGAEPVKYNFAEKDNSSSKKYTSVTMLETSSVHATASINMDGVSATSSVNYRRDFKTYFTESAAYYVIDCVMSMSASSAGEHYGANISMNMELFIDKSVAMLKFNRFVMAAKGVNTTGVEKILGKWIEFEAGDYVVSSLISVNDSNFAFLELLGEYIQSYRETGFGQSGKIYTMKDEAFNNFVAEVLAIYNVGADITSDEIDLSGNLQIDLSNNDNPKVKFSYNESYRESSSISSRANENDLIEFKNINNTVVKRPANVKTYSVEELEELLGGE